MNFVSFKALAAAKFYHFHLILLFSFQNLKRFFSAVEKSSVLLIQKYIQHNFKRNKSNSIYDEV